jgi:hypothetical protein
VFGIRERFWNVRAVGASSLDEAVVERLQARLLEGSRRHFRNQLLHAHRRRRRTAKSKDGAQSHCAQRARAVPLPAASLLTF